MITFDTNGSFIDYWIPSVNATSNQWGSNPRDRASTHYWWHSQFLHESIFLEIRADSSNTIDFPNGSIACPNTGECSVIAKVNLNGTLENYVALSNNRNSQSYYDDCSSDTPF